jgi:DNA-binding MarR family transcriptional regulator
MHHRDELAHLLGAIEARTWAARSGSGRGLGLPPLERCVLSRLVLEGAASMKTLVADLGVARSTMTDLVSRLEQLGLVARRPNPDDGRSVVVEASERAVGALLCGMEGLGDVAASILGNLGSRERDELLRLLRVGCESLMRFSPTPGQGSASSVRQPR